jgi:hypothetical protein
VGATTSSTKMKKSFKTRWLKALASGIYKHGTGRLRLEDVAGKFSYCCLGVAREVFKLKGTSGGAYLTEESLEKLGLTEEEQNKLANLNDESKSFRPVIRYITQKL